jgi:hypothetical protein
MNALWSTYGLEVSISVGAALLTAVGIRLRLWARGEQDEDAPMLRQIVAYLLAYLAGFAAIRGLEGTARYLLMIAAAALAFGVTINGPVPLRSQSYVRSVGIALCGIFVLLGLYALLTWLGVDLTKEI